MKLFTQILLILILKPYLMASPWEQEFKYFKPKPPSWLSIGRKATPGVDYYDPRKPYKYWIDKEIRNNDVELQKVINGKLIDDVKNRRNRSSLKPKLSMEVQSLSMRTMIHYGTSQSLQPPELVVSYNTFHQMWELISERMELM